MSYESKNKMERIKSNVQKYIYKNKNKQSINMNNTHYFSPRNRDNLLVLPKCSQREWFSLGRETWQLLIIPNNSRMDKLITHNSFDFRHPSLIMKKQIDASPSNKIEFIKTKEKWLTSSLNSFKVASISNSFASNTQRDHKNKTEIKLLTDVFN